MSILTSLLVLIVVPEDGEYVKPVVPGGGAVLLLGGGVLLPGGGVVVPLGGGVLLPGGGVVPPGGAGGGSDVVPGGASSMHTLPPNLMYPERAVVNLAAVPIPVC